MPKRVLFGGRDEADEPWLVPWAVLPVHAVHVDSGGHVDDAHLPDDSVDPDVLVRDQVVRVHLRIEPLVLRHAEVSPPVVRCSEAGQGEKQEQCRHFDFLT